ncbi:SH3 and multiple ankyrin repeat domains protein 3 isoform X3 [Strongylocentrotus purpuratus]|uniref:SH3 and multiple ankyrin repeat domains protein 3 n=1 Tax=Strongylocentrotus purpuratus TaxID=7668 RepID=A0A7M7P377_STRPU|nr:SH3 and multiple ankyrin repeat domains protein 3 isoform X3 [Strongylocentrotus purpuratus]
MERRRGACKLLARRRTRSWYGGGELVGGVDAVDHSLAKSDLSKSYTSLLAASRKADLRAATVAVPHKVGCQGFVDIASEELPPSNWCFNRWEESVLFVGLIDDYVSRTQAKTKMAMELPFGKTNGTANGTRTVPNGTLESPSLPAAPDSPDLGELINIRIKIADTEIQKSVCFRKDERIWNMKQHILQCPDVELPDSRNHGFYMLPQNNKAGKFLDEERLISDYPIDKKRPYLEFRYKKRVYRQLNLDVNTLRKFHTKSTLKQFMDHVRNRHVDKINKLADKGLDPNFHEEATGETPLTIAVSMDRCEDVLKALVNGGAHLDFRNRHGFTPVHRAVQKGNVKSLDILLDLGASPNSKDDRGLSPLYYSIVTDSGTHITELLLKDCAEVSPVDSQGWGLIHYACRYGRVRALKLLLLYGSNLSLVNEAGNTPLHVSALYSQEECALMLMDRGADRVAKNKANQTPFQVAILANNFELAELIRNHSGQILGAYTKKLSSHDTPTFSKRRRWANYVNQTQSLSQVRGQAFLEQSEDKYGPQSRMSLATIPGSPEKKSLSNGSAGGASTQKAPMIHRRIKEAPKGRYYIAKQNYSAQEVGELSLHKGDHVEVTAIGEYNYWQGSVAHSMGWFPSYCVEAVSPKYKKSSSKLNLAEDVPISNSVPSFDGAEQEQNSDPRIACVQRGKKGFGFVLRGAKSPQGGAVSFTPTKDFPALQYLEHVDKGSPGDKAGLKMGDFILEINGEDVSSAPHQYVVNLVVSSPDTIVIKIITVPNSKAYSWLKEGGTLRRSGNGPHLPISTPATKSIAISSQDQNSNSPSIPVSTPTTRSISISSQEQHAVDELDKAIDSASTTPKYVSPASSRCSSIQEDEPKTASIRKRPIRQVSQQQLKGIFQRQGSSSSETNLNSMPDDAFVQKPAVPVLPSSKFNTVARMSNSKSPRQQSLEEIHSSVARRSSGGSDSAVSSLHSSPASSNSYMTASSVTDSAVHLKTERTASNPSLAMDLKNVSPKSLQGTAKKPSPMPPTRSQSLMDISIANSVNNSPMLRRAGDGDTLQRRPIGNGVSPSSSTMAVEIEVHRSASGNDSSDDSSSTGSFASAIALAAAKMEKKKESEEPTPQKSSAFEMAMAAKQNYAQPTGEGQNLNRNQNQNVESPSSTQVALQEAIAKRKQRLESVSDNKSGNIEDTIRKYKQQDRAARPKTGQAAFLDAIAKRRSIVESQSPSSEEESSSESMPSSPMGRFPPVKPSNARKTSPANNSRPSGNQIAEAASAMQNKIASRPPIKEEKSRHKNVIRVSPRNKNEDSTDSSDGDVPPISVKNLKQSFEKSKKLSPRDSKALLLSPVREDETFLNSPIPPPPAFLENDTSNLTSENMTPENSHQLDIDILPPPPSFIEDGDQGKFRREQPFDTASMVSSVSSVSTMSSYSTMSTDPSSNDGFEPIGEESHSNSNTLRSDVSSSGSSSSTLTMMSTGETNDNWIKAAPPVATKPSKKSLINDNDITNGVTNGNDNHNPSQAIKSVSEWTVEDVSDWLEELNLGEYKESFTDNAISGEHLTSLGKEDLSELGVKRLGHRLTIIKALQKLQNQ